MDLRRMIQARWTPADVATLLLVSKSWSENVLLLKALLAAANKKMEEQAPRLLPRPVHEYKNYCNYCRAGEAPTLDVALDEEGWATMGSLRITTSTGLGCPMAAGSQGA